MTLCDTHTHTMYSHDSSADPAKMCESAIRNGLSAITFTEHCDIDFMFEEHDTFACLGRSIDMARELNSKYDGVLSVYSGFEVSEGFWNPTNYKRVMDAYYDKIDAILCSVHMTRYPGITYVPNSAHNYSEYSDGMINSIINCYYDDIIEMLKFSDKGNVLCHLTYPFRYINLKYGIKSFRHTDYIKKIKTVLELTVKKEMALEINTSNIGKYENAAFMPDADIVELYRNLGGRLITLGSDAHTPDDVGNSFEKALGMIKKCGFSEYFYYKNKQPMAVKL